MDMLAEANRLQGAGSSGDLDGRRTALRPGAARRCARRRAQALAAGRIGYTDTLGIAELRARHRAALLSTTTGSSVPATRIAVTTGSSAAFNLAFLAMFDPGDRVAIAAPGYPAYRNIMAALGLEVVEIELEGEAYLGAGHLQGRA